MLTTRWWREMVGEPGGTRGLDDAFARLHDPGIGAEIMGARKFGYPGWHEDPEWKGWWGSDPPFHTPVFVLTHHPRPPIEMEGGTTFHFLDTSPAKALETARDAASGQDVRIGGGPTTIREFVAAGLVDHMHIVVVPILLGRGVRLWDGLETTMRSIRLHRRGGPDELVLEDAPVPEIGAADVLVRVSATGITPTELRWDETYQHADGTPRIPSTPGHEVSGVVERVAPD